MRHLRRLGHCIVAGALTGAAVAPLQLLLWPELSIGAGKAILFLLAWASWGALWFGIAFFALVELASVPAPHVGRNPGFSIGLWRWLAAATGFLVGGVAQWNHDRTVELLASARREALTVAAMLSAAFALAHLVLALGRRPRRRGLLVSAVAAGLWVTSLWVVWVATTTPALPPLVAETSPTVAPARRVLLVSWEGADVPWLLPAIERGDMPFLRERWKSGAWGQLRTVRPYSRSAALTTLATGAFPSIHGVVGRRVYRLRWLQEDPLALLLLGPWPIPHQLPWRAWERAAAPPPRVAPLWRIYQGTGLTAGLVGWPGMTRATWTVPRPLASEALDYQGLSDELRAALDPALSAHPEFAPSTRDAFAVAVELAAMGTLQAAADPVDALVVNSELPARLRPLWTAEVEGVHGEVLRQAMQLLDEQLRALWAVMGGEDVLLVVASPYGLAPPSSWERLQNAVRGSRRWKVSPSTSPDGFVLFSGPGVRPGTRLRTSKLVDVVPTLLYLVDMPVARTMSGRVLVDAVSEELASTRPLQIVPAYPYAPTQARRPAN